MELSDRIGIVTGASSGIGQAIALSLLKSGARLVINARRKEALLELERLYNTPSSRRVVSVIGDATEETVINQLFVEAQSSFGSAANLVVVNAGRGLGGSILSGDLSKFEEILKLNVVAASRLMQKAAQSFLTLNKTSSVTKDIVVLGSISGKAISPFSAIYGATKFALNSLTEALRREMSAHNVRVSGINPAIVRSEFQAGAGYTDEWERTVAAKYEPLLTPDDIARLVNFIVSQPPHVNINDVVIRPTRQDLP